MKTPEIGPALRLVEDGSVRKQLYTAYSNLARQNTPIIEGIVAKRNEMASLLGFSSYSEYTLKRKMAKNPQTVQTFEQDLTHLIIKKAGEERKKLVKFKRSLTKKKKDKLDPWDHSFYDHKYIKKEYNYDSELVKEYFPTERVIKQTFDIYQQLL